jgi:hypothetical protein
MFNECVICDILIKYHQQAKTSAAGNPCETVPVSWVYKKRINLKKFADEGRSK